MSLGNKPLLVDWEKRYRALLKEEYSDYLRDTVLGDENFDVTSTESYDEWVAEEYYNTFKYIN